MKSWKMLVYVTPVAAAMVLAGCGNSPASKSTPKQAANSVMTLGFDNGSPTFTNNFNPYSPNLRWGSYFIYETMYAINTQNGHQTPWLASGYKWDSPTKLTFTIQKGIKWSDGQAFSANDVAFTFNMLKKNPALDTNSVWTVLQSVTAPDANTVTFVFKQAAIPTFTYICDTPIVPEHVWQKVANPVTYTNTNPVGTGAFKLSAFTVNQYTLVKNPSYWQASKVAATKIIVPALTGNDTSDLNLSSGKYTWANLFVPNIDKTYTSRDPQNNHYWFAPGGPSNLVMNLTKAPFNNPIFRQAMEYGIDKNTVSSKGEYGYQPPADATGLMIPGQASWLSPSLKGKLQYDPKKAATLLASIGYKKNASGQLLDASGKPVTFNITVPGDYTDWIQTCKVIEGNLKDLGITLNLQTPSDTGWYNQLQTGEYDMSLTYGLNAFDPWFYYSSVLSSANTAPIGKPASSNFERWKDTSTDKLLLQYQETTDKTLQQKIITQLQKTMVTQVPLIPLFYNANWNEYSTKDFVGWPDASNPYATPDFLFQDNEVIMTHLKLSH